MKLSLLSLFLVSVFLAGVCAAQQAATGRPTESAGKLEIAKYPMVLDAPIGPQKPSIDPVKLHAEATELATLAQSVPSDIDQVAQGKLPKDMADKLKRIEKLSKHLRGELLP